MPTTLKPVLILNHKLGLYQELRDPIRQMGGHPEYAFTFDTGLHAIIEGTNEIILLGDMDIPLIGMAQLIERAKIRNSDIKIIAASKDGVLRENQMKSGCTHEAKDQLEMVSLMKSFLAESSPAAV